MIRAQDRANEQLGANLANIMLTCRFAHYLKAILRDNLGAKTSAGRMQKELDEWIRQYWVDMDDPDPITMARKPLRKYKIEVKEKEDEPGYYYIDFEMTPHSRFVGADISMSLVAGRAGRQSRIEVARFCRPRCPLWPTLAYYQEVSKGRQPKGLGRPKPEGDCLRMRAGTRR